MKPVIIALRVLLALIGIALVVWVAASYSQRVRQELPKFGVLDDIGDRAHN